MAQTGTQPWLCDVEVDASKNRTNPEGAFDSIKCDSVPAWPNPREVLLDLRHN